MKEITGNIWDADLDVICATTNGITNKNGELIMGKGFALEISQRFPGIAKVFGNHVLHFGNVPYLYRNYPIIKELHVLSIPTKHHWKDHSDINLIENSIKLIVEIADHNLNFRRIGMTRPGCGNGGLEWGFVKSIIEPYLDDRFIVFNQEINHE